MAWKHNDRVIRVGKSWTSDDGYRHPYNWQSSWTEQNKIDFKVVWEDDPDTSYDDKFYFAKDTSWADEIDEFAEVIMKNKKVMYGNIYDSLAVMMMIDKIYKNDKRIKNVSNK